MPPHFRGDQAFSVSSDRNLSYSCYQTGRRTRRRIIGSDVDDAVTARSHANERHPSVIGGDLRLVIAALAGIALAVVMIVRGRLHPFIGLLCGAFTVGLLAGLPLPDVAKAVQKGVGDIIGGTGLVVALGLSLGAMLHLSGAAASLARSALQMTGARAAPWATLGIAIVVGLPLFFETGLVLLLPIVVAAAEEMTGEDGPARDAAKLRLIMPALAGLGVVHALVPPHPGPLLGVEALGADLGRTMLYGILIAIPSVAHGAARTPVSRSAPFASDAAAPDRCSIAPSDRPSATTRPVPPMMSPTPFWTALATSGSGRPASSPTVKAPHNRPIKGCSRPRTIITTASAMPASAAITSLRSPPITDRCRSFARDRAVTASSTSLPMIRRRVRLPV